MLAFLQQASRRVLVTLDCTGSVGIQWIVHSCLCHHEGHVSSGGKVSGVLTTHSAVTIRIISNFEELARLGQNARLLFRQTIAIVHLLEAEAKVSLVMARLLHSLTVEDKRVDIRNHNAA